MTLSSPIPPAQSLEQPRKNLFGSTTVGVVAAILFLLGAPLFFQYVPSAFRWPVRVVWFASVIWVTLKTARALRTTRFTGRKIAFILVLGGFYYLVLSLVCHVFIKLMSQRDDRLTIRGMTSLSDDCKRGIQATIDDDKFNVFSADMGWLPRSRYKTDEYTVNSQGLRGVREYPLQPANPDLRILCLGDSFTFGIAVKDKDTYPAQAEQLKPGTEWVNFGIPGGCLTQSYQRYMHEARNYGGKRVVIGFMTNDAQRTVNAFRPFLNADSGCPLTKPFAKYADGKFTIEPNPYQTVSDLKRLLADETNEQSKLLKLDYLTWSGQGFGRSGPISRTFFYVWDSMDVDLNLDSLLAEKLRPGRYIKSLAPRDPYGIEIWNPDGPGFKAICGMFDQFRKQVVADGRDPLFVIIPGPIDVSNVRKHRSRQYAVLVDYLKANDYPFIDFLDPLLAKHPADLSEDALFVRFHYQPPVNKELAEEIIKALHLP